MSRPSQVGVGDALSRRLSNVDVQPRKWQAEFRSDCLYSVNIRFPRSSITQSVVKNSGSPARSNAVGGREGYRLRHESAREGKVRGLADAHATVESEPIEGLTT